MKRIPATVICPNLLQAKRLVSAAFMLSSVSLLASCITDYEDPADHSTAVDIIDDALIDGDTSDDEIGADIVEDAPPACTPEEVTEPEPFEPEARNFALSMYHFNVEYVLGGLETTDENGNLIRLAGLSTMAGWNAEKVEDYIIEETFHPLLEIYDRHPAWQATLEFQAYMVEVMAARHPDTLELLRKLALRGQVELVSFHYAAQLFLAFPRGDQERSLDLVRSIFDEHCLPLSGVVFNQEGQAGEGRQQLLVERGYSIGIHPKNLFRYVQNGVIPAPVYSSEGGYLIVGPGEVDPASGFQVTWSFFDDGELAVVPDGLNPYFAPVAPATPDRIAAVEAELAELEAAGWKISTIGNYVQQVVSSGVTIPPAPPLLDGTWQPPSTDSIHRWLGGRSQANIGEEEDNRVRAGNAAAREALVAFETLVAHAESQGQDVASERAELAALWKVMLRAEVSDASGVNPWRGEILFALRANDEVSERSTEGIRRVLDALQYPHAQIDAFTGTVTRLEDLPIPEAPETVEAPIVAEFRADGREVTQTWYAAPGTRRSLILNFSQVTADASCSGCDYQWVSVGFPRTEDKIQYSPGLLDDQVRSYNLSDFSFLSDEVYLPLANGLIGLGGNKWIIKRVTSTHIAARVSPSDGHIRFIDKTPRGPGAISWAFEYFEGSEAEAVELANRLNVAAMTMW